MNIFQTTSLAGYALAFCLFACSPGKSSHSSADGEGCRAELILARSTALALDSLKIEVSGPDMETTQKSFQGMPAILDLGALPPGEDRRFVVSGYAEGRVVQQGESVVDLVMGETRQIQISLRSLFGSFVLRVPLGLENPLGVSAGTLIYSGAGLRDTLALQGSLPIREFRSGALPMGKEYVLDMELVNASGTPLFRGKDTVWIDADSPWVTLELSSLVSMVRLSLTLAANAELPGKISLQGARTRTPARLYDLLILELLPHPKTGGTDWEYIELLNTTADTLSLLGCRLAKDQTTTGSTTSASLDSCSVGPGDYLVIGRDSVSVRGCSAGGFSLSNSGQGVVVVCNGILVDSVAYGSASDSLNPFPLEEGKSLQVPLANYLERMDGSAWCTGMDLVELGNNLSVLGSPGVMNECP